MDASGVRRIHRGFRCPLTWDSVFRQVRGAKYGGIGPGALYRLVLQYVGAGLDGLVPLVGEFFFVVAPVVGGAATDAGGGTGFRHAVAIG